MHKIFYRIGLRHITSKPWRTLLTTLGIALGVALYIGTHIINKSTLQSFRETIDSMSGKATLTVFGGDAGFAESKLEIVQKVKGVKAAVPLISNRAYLVNREHATESLMILGVDLLKEQSVRNYKTADERVIEDPFTFLNQADSIIVTRSFAEEHQLQIDSSFDVATASGHKKLTVRGLLTPDGVAKAYGGALAVMDIDGARMTFGKENKIDRIDIVTSAQADIEAVATNLRHSLGAGYRIERPETQSQNVEKLIASYQAMLAFFSTLALVVGLFFVSNSMSTAVSERRREIGTLRALGATRNNVLVLFLIEACSMGIVGASIGVAAGRGIAGLLVKMVTRSISIQYTTQVQTTHLIFGWAEVTRGVAIGTAAAVIAALWPSFKAATISPLTAMKKNQVSGLVRRKFRFGLGFSAGLAFIFFFVLASFFHWGADCR